LQFHAHKDRFDCTRDELIKLGKRADPTIVDDGAALRHGATQFKVNFDQLRKVIHESEWATKNILRALPLWLSGPQLRANKRHGSRPDCFDGASKKGQLKRQSERTQILLTTARSRE
jgi:hypothetical protein